MQPKQITWIGFLVALSALNLPSKAIASNTNLIDDQPAIENRLARIAENLKAREEELSNLSDSDLESTNPNNTIARGWLKGYRGGFVNGGGGGFLNRRGWPDRGGFWNRRWPNGGGFLNRW